MSAKLRAPSLALAVTAAEPPTGNDWVHEVKFDGYRLAATVERGAVRLTTRNQLDWTDRFPATAAALAALPVETAVLDGEIVALTAAGRSDFSLLQRSLGKTGGKASRARLVYQVFDLLQLDGADLRGLPLLERKTVLARVLQAPGVPVAGDAGGSGVGANEAVASSPSLRYTEHLFSPGPDTLREVCRLGLEGIVSKRSSAPYRAGRTRDWLKSSCLAAGDFVVGGYTRPRGSRSGFGALLLGEFRSGEGLDYVGKVGSGFSLGQLSTLTQRLERMAVSASPFAGPVPRQATSAGVTWVAPRLVVEVRYAGRTNEELLRQARFRGVREDKVSEMPATPDTTGDDIRLLGVRLSSPDRVVYTDQGVTKRELAEYYAGVADELLRYAAQRPLSLVRCPDGSDAHCFYQKHPGAAFAADLPRVAIEESEGVGDYLYLKAASDVVALVQAGVLEVHAWGSRVDDLERPDQLVFDLDPAEDVPWSFTKQTARDLRALLARLGLTGFLRTTGGKGLHVVVPLEPDAAWDTAKAFAKGVAEALEANDRARLTTALRKAKRGGKVFIDYLRNGRGATAIVNYSARARAGAPVAVPLRWDELGRLKSSAAYGIGSVGRRLGALKDDPWAGFEDARRPLSAVLNGELNEGAKP